MSIYLDYLKENYGFDIDDGIIVNEVYFGKNKYLLEAEEVLGRIRQEYQDNQIRVNSSKDILEFNRLMEKAFKLECFCLNIQYTGLIDAFTIPVSTCIDAPNFKAKSNELGFNYDNTKGSSIIVWVTSGMLFNKDITDGEIMAFIVHEIGHNFQVCISPMSRGYSYVSRAMAILYMPIYMATSPGLGLSLTTGTRKWYTELLEEWRNEDNEFYNLLNTFKYIWSKIVSIVAVPFHLIGNIGSMIKGPIVPIPSIRSIPSILNNVFGFKNETIADNFATAYGYGPELTSVLNKAKYKVDGWKDEEIIRNIPVLGAWLDFCNFPTTVLLSIIDGHPNDAHRVKHQINMLKTELNKSDLDPKMKGKIRNDIDSISKQLNECVKVANEKMGWGYTNAWSAFLLAVCNGDLRSAISKNNFELFDKAYEENLVKIQRNKK